MTSAQELLGRPEGSAAHQLLRDLRQEATLTGAELAQRLEWTQSKISKIENAKQIPTDDETMAWLEACGASAEIRRTVLRTVAEHRTSHREWRERLRQSENYGAVQQQYGRVAHEAQLIRNMEVLRIPGLLQTPDYARAVLTQNARRRGSGVADSEIEAAVNARIARQGVLYDTSKSLEFVITEAALYLLICPPIAMLGQLDRLLVAMSLPQIQLGIVPFREELAVLPPQNSFIIFDDDLAVVETLAEETVHTGVAVSVYTSVMDELAAVAWRGERAKALIVKAAQDLSAATA